MPKVPTTGKVTKTAKNSVTDGVLYGLSTGIGRGALGGIGHGLGGIVAGSSIGGSKGEMMASFAIGEAVQMSLMGGNNANSSGNSGRRRM